MKPCDSLDDQFTLDAKSYPLSYLEEALSET